MATNKKYLMAAAGSAGGGEVSEYWINVSGGTGSDFGYGVTVDSSDNTIICGYTQSDGAGASDFIVAKYDSLGSLLWERLLGGSGTEIGYGVTVDSSDNIIVTGYTSSDGAGNNDVLIVKYDSSGTLLWDKTLGGSGDDQGYGVTVDSSDNIVVAGYTQSDGAGGYDFLVAKYNSSGTLLWDKTLGGANSDFSRGIAVDSSDNIIVAGYTISDGAGSYDVLIAKYNSSGTLQWDRTLGGTVSDFAFGVALDSLDNIVVAGRTNSEGAGGLDALLAKYNSSGTLQWQRTLGGTGTEFWEAITVDSLDNIIVAGYTDSDGAGGNDILVAKYDSSGTLLWDRTLGGTGSDIGYGVTIDSSDNIIVAGKTSSDGNGSSEIIIAKLPSDGSLEGTYGAFTYADAVLTDAAASLTDAPAVLTDAAAVLTDAAAVLTETKTYTLYTIS